MRTTLSIDDDVMDLVSRQAKLRGQTLGKTVTELLRRGLTMPAAVERKGDIDVFWLSEDSPVVTTGDVRRIEAEDV